MPDCKYFFYEFVKSVTRYNITGAINAFVVIQTSLRNKNLYSVLPPV